MNLGETQGMREADGRDSCRLQGAPLWIDQGLSLVPLALGWINLCGGSFLLTAMSLLGGISPHWEATDGNSGTQRRSTKPRPGDTS